MKDPAAENVTVIIRGVKERTENLCKSLLEQEIASQNVHLVHQSPFSAALKTSYQIGIDSGRKWTLVIDGDVLIRPGIIRDLYLAAETAPKSVFVTQSEMLDKFFGGVRVGGIKVYRSELLVGVLDLIPPVHDRPETFINKHMHVHGRYINLTHLVCGLHDFEQYYEDVFRKGFTHSIKHSKLIDAIFPYWQRQAQADKDFRVLLAGYEAGKQHQAKLKLNKEESQKQFKSYLKKTGLKEKSKLNATKLSLDDVAKLVNNFEPPPEYKAVKTLIDQMGKPYVPGKISRLVKRPGNFR